MTTRRIVTENPSLEQWRLLSQFHYEPNIRRFAEMRNHDLSNKTVNYIAGSLRQGEAYFKAAQTSTIDISPLLLYYGLTNLMAGTAALLTGDILNIKAHGMTLVPPDSLAFLSSGMKIEPQIDGTSPCDDPDYQYQGLCGLEVLPRDGQHSGLFQLIKVYSPQNSIKPHLQWSLGELLGSVPDVRDDYIRRYETAPLFVVPVQLVRRRHSTIEKISVEDLKTYAQQFLFEDGKEIYTGDYLKCIPRFSDAYLYPQRIAGGYVPLRRKLNGIDLGIYSLHGKRFLPLPHVKTKSALRMDDFTCPSQLIIVLMALFILGTLSRYHPAIWNPFVASDSSGERMLIEQFLHITRRYAPNLILNSIYECHLLFVPPFLEGSIIGSLQDEFDSLISIGTRQMPGNPIPALWNQDEMKKWINEIINDRNES